MTPTLLAAALAKLIITTDLPLPEGTHYHSVSTVTSLRASDQALAPSPRSFWLISAGADYDHPVALWSSIDLVNWTVETVLLTDRVLVVCCEPQRFYRFTKATRVVAQ